MIINQSINLKSFYSGIKENKTNISDFENIGNQLKMNNYNFNFLYDLNFGNYQFKLNSDYLINQGNYHNTDNHSNHLSSQNFREFAIAPSLYRRLNDNSILGLMVIYADRNFETKNTNKNQVIYQKFVNSILNFSYSFPTTYLSSIIKYEYYKDPYRVKKSIIPSLRISQEIGKHSEITASYKKIFKRPSIYYLSGYTYQNPDGSLTYSNPSLNFQKEDSYNISFEHEFKK